MHLRHIFFLILLLASFSSHAFELLMIQAISDTKRTFLTRNGIRQGVTVGNTGTFTAEDVSILAKAINVSGNFTQWQILNPEATVPFEKGAVVTFYPATEYLWALAPESERKKYIKSEIPVPKSSLIFKGAFTHGLSESVSDAPASNGRRGGFLGEVYYEKEIYYGLAFDLGLRYEREIINYQGASFVTRRSIAIAQLIYYFDNLKDLLAGGRYFLSGGFGYGQSNTTAIGLSQSGPVSILPIMRAGVSLPFNETWEFLVDGAFESLQTREQQKSGRFQTTTQTNFKAGFGLRRFF